MLGIQASLVKSMLKRTLDVGAGQVSHWLGGDTLNLPPEIRHQRIDRLYELAKRDQWNASDILDTEVGRAELSALEPEERKAMARVISQIYYGERGALLTSAQLAVMVPDQESSAFLTSQCFDEARHMEIFGKLARMLDDLHEINPFLRLLLTDMLRTNYLVEKLIGMNLLVEGLALSVFHHMLKIWKDHPRLQGDAEKSIILRPLAGVVRDESRHVGFGMIYLPELVKKLSLRRRMQVKARQILWMGLLYGSVKYHESDSALLGLSFMSVLDKILEDHAKRTAEMGISVVVTGGGLHRLIPTFDAIVNAVLQQKIEVKDFNLAAA